MGEDSEHSKRGRSGCCRHLVVVVVVCSAKAKFDGGTPCGIGPSGSSPKSLSLCPFELRVRIERLTIALIVWCCR